jgi:hypothetical protein
MERVARLQIPSAEPRALKMPLDLTVDLEARVPALRPPPSPLGRGKLGPAHGRLEGVIRDAIAGEKSRRHAIG